MKLFGKSDKNLRGSTMDKLRREDIKLFTDVAQNRAKITADGGDYFIVYNSATCLRYHFEYDYKNKKWLKEVTM